MDNTLLSVYQITLQFAVRGPNGAEQGVMSFGEIWNQK